MIMGLRSVSASNDVIGDPDVPCYHVLVVYSSCKNKNIDLVSVLKNKNIEQMQFWKAQIAGKLRLLSMESSDYGENVRPVRARKTGRKMRRERERERVFPL